MTDNWTIGSTVVTAVATGVALWVAGRGEYIRAAERRDERQAQARLLSVYVNEGDTEAVVRNYSNEPIREIRWYDAGARNSDGGTAAVVRFQDGERRERGHLPPGESFTVPLARFGWGDELPESAAPAGSTIWVTVHYMDAHGFWWSRTGDRQPVPLHDGPGEPLVHD
ncbi:hypothetical protein GFH48_12710 [Streptomyces fagopyri]|uniref:Uncharacterized protein n=1 Tax=Streptomyces fagopyri TaxID=2662397 RepID=A0A5Q0LA90_9ACTN|nr:hypothetical protein [Streptomyces fagopyri]QFZ73992.1 hypothetical protein GFH48_12710 [Streptomyces fagopyri]